MDISTKLAVLRQIYRIYDEFSRNQRIACERYCAQCCTAHVTMTTLEGYMIVEYLLSEEMSFLFEKIEAALSGTAASLAPVGTMVYKGEDLAVRDGQPGPNTQKLREALQNIQYGAAPDTHGWLTEVG